MAQFAITVKNTSKSFGKVTAVRDLSFEVEADTCFGFLGPNGAGKTTMMKMLYGKCTLDNTNGSSVEVFGYNPVKEELAIKYFSGVVPQDNNLDYTPKIDCAGKRGIADVLLDGCGFTGKIGFVRGGAAFGNFGVHGKLRAGLNQKAHSGFKLFHLDLAFVATCIQRGGDFRRVTEK